MAQRGWIGLRNRLARLGLAAALAIALPSCTSPRIQITASDASALRSAPAVELLLVPTKKGESAALPESATTALVERADESLRAKGYRASEDGSRPVVLELALRTEQVSRRSYTADADANGVRLVKRTEAIVALRAVGPDGKTEIWRCEARELLPKRDAPFAPSDDAIFDRLLERALARIPARP